MDRIITLLASNCMTKRNFLSAAFISVFGIGCKKAPGEKSEDHLIEITNAKLGESSSDDVFLAKRVDAPWGDYGSILINGIVSGGGRREADRFDVLSLERTGPFVPPISFPGIGNIVVTDAMKQAMEHAGFRGIQYQVVRKKLIVESDWHTWDRSAKEPVRYPEGGEPEGYIDERKHSEKVSQQIGTLWSITLSPGAEFERFETGPNKYLDIEDRYVPGTWKGADIFSTTRNGRCYLSARAADWFREHFGDWIDVRPVSRTNAADVKQGSP